MSSTACLAIPSWKEDCPQKYNYVWKDYCECVFYIELKSNFKDCIILRDEHYFEML